LIIWKISRHEVQGTKAQGFKGGRRRSKEEGGDEITQEIQHDQHNNDLSKD